MARTKSIILSGPINGEEVVMGWNDLKGLRLAYMTMTWSYIAHLQRDIEEAWGVDEERWMEDWSRLQQILDEAEANIPKDIRTFWDMVDGNWDVILDRLQERLESMSEEERVELFKYVKKLNNNEI